MNVQVNDAPQIPAATYWILRIAVFGTFLGHGVFALGVKPEWIPYLTTIGFSVKSAQQLMPLIGSIDIAVAVMALLFPLRIVFVYAFIWAFLTATIRPFAGLPVWDFVERAANWGAPLAYLFLVGMPKSFRELFRK